MQENISVNDISALDLKGKAIQDLNQVPENYRDLEQLSLDNNYLENLQGIELFQNVKQLSLLNNQVTISPNLLYFNFLPEIFLDSFFIDWRHFEYLPPQKPPQP